MKSEQYIKEVARTASDQFHDDIIPVKDVVYQLVDFEILCRSLDNSKKALYYGKMPKPIPNIVLPQHTNVDKDELHFLVGAITELAELSEVLRAKWNGEDVGSKVVDETGDLLWYTWNLMRVTGQNPDVTMEGNIAKLKARFPEKFSEAAAIDRNESEERSALEEALEA